MQLGIYRIPDTLAHLTRVFENAQLCMFDTKRMLFLLWYGGQTIGVYDGDGEEVAAWTIDNATRSTVRANMAKVIRDGRYPWHRHTVQMAYEHVE